MRRIILSLGVLLLASPPVSAQTGRQLTLEDYYSVRSIGSPRISPAGDWIAYTVSLRIEETNGTATESWIVRADGSAEPVRVQHDGQDVSDPGWSDDGHLRFSSGNANWLTDPARLNESAVRDDGVESAGARSPNGRFLARTGDMPMPAQIQPEMTAFEKRHEVEGLSELLQRSRVYVRGTQKGSKGAF